MDEPPLPFPDEPAHADKRAQGEAHAGLEPPILIIDDTDRYGRLRLIPWWRQERLAAARVLVVGAGALGNEVLKNLVLVGAGTVYVIDLDTVEPSNLSRSVLFRAEDGGQPKAVVAARRSIEINPEVTIVPIHGDVITDLGLGLFADVDVVIGCLDNREARLWVNRQCWKVGTPWVDAGIQEIQGVVKVFVPPDSACYECAMTTRDYQLLNLRYSCPLLRRDQILEGKVPTAPTIASMMAALEVQEALKLIHGLPVAAGSAFVFNGVTNQFYTTKLPFRDDCLSHETYPSAVELPLGNGVTLATLFEAARSTLAGPLALALERDLVVALDCPRCGWRAEVFRPRTRAGTVPEARKAGLSDAHCQEPLARAPKWCTEIDDDSPLGTTRTLADLGIPAYDIVRIDGAAGSGFFLLAADRSRLDALAGSGVGS